ncbi:hypothetical protein DFJ74DRAFT_669337 [Hyaloraphidium curvatum]|nr:hypothetical protein DFJ74DRAFT_669337 [Hyaloraphidium curvatum]
MRGAIVAERVRMPAIRAMGTACGAAGPPGALAALRSAPPRTTTPSSPAPKRALQTNESGATPSFLRTLFGAEHRVYGARNPSLLPARTFHSSPSAGQRASGPGPLNSKAQAVPFTLTRAQALEKFEEHHNSGLLRTSRFAKIVRIDPVFVPFWVGTAEVAVRVLGGEVGFERMEPRYDFRTRRWTAERVTVWQHIDREFEWERRYDPADAENGWLFQPAAFDYPRRYVARLAEPALIAQAKQFTPDMADDPDPENPRGARLILPFETPPNVAHELLQSLISDREKMEAENVVKRYYNADNVRLLRVQLAFPLWRLTPFYLPAYAFSTEYLGTPFHTLISGATGRAAGQHYFSWERVAILSAAAGGLYALAAGLTRVLSATSVFWGFLVLPALLGAYASRYYPLAQRYLLSRYQEFERRREAQRAASSSSSAWEENIGGYRREREEERRRADGEYAYERARAGRPAPAPGDVRDPKGYYKALGVKPDAGKEEIQAAFRGLAMKDHPDRYSDPKDKEAAKKRFQKLSEAYTVLRDARKRREYDLYGRT